MFGKKEEKIPNEICVICHKDCEDQFGNNAYPLASGRCCNQCNKLVVEYRIAENQLRKSILAKVKRGE